MARGMNAYREQARAAGERRLTGFASILLLKSGESVKGRFRGLFVEPTVKFTQEQILAMSPDWLAYHAHVLGIAPQKTMDMWVQAFLLRYKQIEPFIYEQHYIHGNKGKDAYATCASRWSPSADCPLCWSKDAGDKRISLRTQHVVSFHPYRWYHKLEGAKGTKATYADCPSINGEACRYCAAGHQPEQEKCRYLSLAEMHMAGLAACIERVAQRCAVCGIGKVTNTGHYCSNPDCGEPLPNYRPLLPNEQPEGYTPVTMCPECKTRMVPAESLRCNKGCDDVRRCQIHDIDVIVQRLGEKKSTTYQFTEQLPAEPLSEDFLASNIPNYEFSLKPKDVTTLCRVAGLTQNPFTGVAVNVAAPDATSDYDESEAAADPYGEGGEEGQPAVDQDIPF